MKKIKKKDNINQNTIFAYSPDQCTCYYPCQCSGNPSSNYVETSNRKTTQMYAGNYLIYN